MNVVMSLVRYCLVAGVLVGFASTAWGDEPKDKPKGAEAAEAKEEEASAADLRKQIGELRRTERLLGGDKKEEAVKLRKLRMALQKKLKAGQLAALRNAVKQLRLAGLIEVAGMLQEEARFLQEVPPIDAVGGVGEVTVPPLPGGAPSGEPDDGPGFGDPADFEDPFVKLTKSIEALSKQVAELNKKVDALSNKK